MTDDYKTMIQNLVFDQQTFVRLTLKGKVRGAAVPWHKIVVRPVLIKNARHVQISYFDAKQDTSKNYRGNEAGEKVAEVLAIPYSSIHVETTLEDLHIQVTKKGKAIIQRGKPAQSAQEPLLAHNRSKALTLAPDEASDFLRRMGMLDQQGNIRPQMQGKFSQINEFLKLLDHTGELERSGPHALTILDCGCGSAHLTFATHYYLNTMRGIPARLIGIDVNQELITKCAVQAAQLGAGASIRECEEPAGDPLFQSSSISFQRSAIIDFQPAVPPDIMLALHACDTATDEAIVQGIRWQARLIVCVPCCHHDLNRQIASEVFRPVLRHGILKQRMADILTDTFRALALRIMGYKTDVIEFISTEHTARNLMIRAVKSTAPGDASMVQEYNDLKQFWNVTPYIEKLLGQPFMTFL